MKRICHISIICRLLVLLGFSGIALNASAEVFYWIGNTAQWDKPSNWEINGVSSRSLPGFDDHVVISSKSQNLEINLRSNVQIASLHVLDDRPFLFDASTPSSIIIAGSFIVSGKTNLSNKVKIVLLGNGLGTYSFPKNIAQQVVYKDSKSKPESADLTFGKSASCPFFTIVPNPSAPTCNGFDDGIASVLPPTDGVGPYAYQWIGGPASPTWLNRSAGTYTVIVTDLGQSGAPCNIDVFVNEPGPLTVFSMNATPPTCADGCDGTAAPLVIGGNGGYSYSWSSGETGFTASNLCAIFTLSIEDSEGCQFDTTYVNTNIPDQIVADATVQDVVCNGDNDGAISVIASGGTGTLTFTWTGPNGFNDTNPDIDNLEPGTYTLTVEDASNCSIVEVYTISQNPTINISSTQVNNACAGDSNGSISVSISGGLPPYTFSWTGPNGFTSSDQNLADLESGNYSLSAIDAANCEVMLSAEITNPPPLSVTISAVDVLCNGENTGSAIATANGGTPNYTYAWSGPMGFTGTGASVSSLAAGTYTVDVTDSQGCILSQQVVINEAAEIIASFTETPIVCTGDANGGIDLIASGGLPPFSFSWTGPGGFTSSDQNISGLSSGTYTVVITDDSNCAINASFDLNDPLPLDATGLVLDESCEIGADGSVTTTISGGTLPYTFSWTGPNSFASDQQDISGLPAGTYTLILSDFLGCSESFSFTVDPPLALTASFDVENNVCFGDTNGEIAATPTSGAPPFSFLWIGPDGFISSLQNIANLASGEYNLQLTDANGCASFFSVDVTEPPQISISRVITPVTCFGGSNGAIAITPSGGTPAYTFQWTGPNGFTATSEDISGIQAGSYEITVTDINGCTRTRIFNVSSPPDYQIDATISNVVCAGDSDGAIEVVVTIGTGPFSYSWTGPNGFSATSQNISNIPAGDYTLVVTGNLGCTKVETYTVGETSVIMASATETPVSCFGFLDGAIDIVVTGGIAPYAITWSGPNGFIGSGTSISGLEPGTYSASIQDDAGCILSFDFNVNEPSEITATFDLTNPSCFGDFTGSISAQLSGGTPPYIDEWVGPDGFVGFGSSIADLQAGIYTLTATDFNGCVFTEAVELIGPTEIIIAVDIIDPTCQALNGSATATASGGTGTLTFQWFDESGALIQNGSILNGVGAGIYTAEATDENGCTVSETIGLSDFTGTLDGVIGEISCFGGADGSIDITVTGGLPPYEFLWSGPNGFSSVLEDISDLEDGLYTVAVTDANGCVLNQAFDLIEPSLITGNPLVVGFSCLGNDGSISLSPSGGTPGYTVSWTGPDGFTGAGLMVSNLIMGTYNFTIQDANGCEETDSVEMIAAPGVSVVESITDALCGNENTGSIETTISGGTPPYNVQWSSPNGFSSDALNIFDLAGDAYTLTIIDALGCEETFLFEVLQPDSIVVELAVSQPDCLTDNGTISAAITGGTVAGDYDVLWTDEAGIVLSNTPDIAGLGSGNYTIAVTDDNGCLYEETVGLSNPGIDVDITISEINCFGFSDGALSVSLIEGVEPASITWTGPNGFSSMSFDIVDLSTGIYTYEVVDADGCVLTDQVTLSEPEELTVSADVLPTCFGEQSGAITLQISGGTPEYTTEWTGPDGFFETSQDIFDLAPGSYTLALADANGCELNSNFDVSENPELTADFAVSPVLCFGEMTGEVGTTVIGGLPPYIYAWSGPNGFTSDQSDIVGLLAGNYSLLVTDSLGCAEAFEIEILQTDSIVVLVTVESPGCDFDGSLGSIDLSISGGIPSYSVLWTGPNGFSSDQMVITDLESGIYTYSIIDSAACGPFEGTVTLNEVTPILVDADIANISCFGSGDGSVVLTISGGQEPYTVLWNGPNGFLSDSQTIVQLELGDYSLLVTDEAGCSASLEVEIAEPEALVVNLIQSTDASCNTSLDGLIEVEASGGAGPYEFAWSGPDGFEADGPLIDGIGQGGYNVLVTDSNGCVAEFDAAIGFILEVLADAGDDQLICFSDMPALITGGGENADIFSWLNADGDTISELPDLPLDLQPGSYSFILIASNGLCSHLDTLELTVPELISVDAGMDREVFAEEVFTLGGAPTASGEVTYLWTPDAMGEFANTAANPAGFVMETTLFTVLVTDADGCQNTDSVLISVLPELNISSGFTPNDDGVNDTWVIDNMELFPNNVVSIFNRWGAVMYQTNRYNMSNAWDGTFENQPVPVGTYYYTIELNDPRFTEPFTGPITIYR